MRRWLTAALVSLAGITDAAAQSCTPYPETFAQGFYRSAYAFFNESPQQVAGLVTPGFLHKLQAERDCVEKKGRCRLQYDPWLGPQGGGVGAPVLFQRESSDGRQAVVAVQYPLQNGGTPQTVRLKLMRTPEDACWRLDDFITPGGESLAALLAPAGG